MLKLRDLLLRDGITLQSRFDTVTWVHTVSQTLKLEDANADAIPKMLKCAAFITAGRTFWFSGKTFRRFSVSQIERIAEASRFQENWNAIRWEFVVWERGTQCERVLKFSSTEKSILFPAPLNVRDRKFKIDAGYWGHFQTLCAPYDRCHDRVAESC